ncbi:MAG: hypothetical protein IJD86_11325 [Clostridia bacterium]|nr:hypothetical protein [Clostridia bacterium]
MKKIISIILTTLLVLSLAGNAYLLVDKKNAANELDAFENTKSQQLASLNAKIDQAEADLLAETEKYNQALEAIQQMDEQALSLHQEIELISVKLSEAENNAANVEALLSETAARADENELLLSDKTKEVDALMAVIEDKDAAFASLTESYQRLEIENKEAAEKLLALETENAEKAQAATEHAVAFASLEASLAELNELSANTQQALDLKTQEYEQLKAKYDIGVQTIATYESEVARLEASIQDLKGEAETLKASIAGMQAEIEAIKAAAAEATPGDAQTVIERTEQTLQALNESTDTLGNMESAIQNTEAISGQIAQTASEAAFKEEIDALKNALAAKEAEISSLSETVLALEAEKVTLESQLAAVSGESESALTLAEVTESNLKAAEEKLSETLALLDEAKKAEEALTAAVAEKETELAAAVAHAGELEAEMEKAMAALNENSRLTEETTLALGKAEAALAQAAEENETLKHTLETANARIEETEKALENANAEILKAEELAAENLAAYEAEKEKSAALTEELAGAKAAYDAESAKTEALTAELASVKAALDEKADALSACEIALGVAKSGLDDAAAALEDTEKLLFDTRAQLEKTESELSETKAQLEKTEGELSEAKAQLEKTEGELSETKAQLESTIAEYDAYIAKRGNTFTAENEVGAGISEIKVTEGGKAVINFTNTSDRPVNLSLVTDGGTELFKKYVYRGATLTEVPVAEVPDGEACWLKAEYLDGNGRVLYSLLTPVEIKAE